VQDQARFTVLSDRLIRMEFAPGGRFNNQATLTFVNRKLPVPKYQVAHTNGWLTISTTYVTLHYKEKSGKFTAENLVVSYHDAAHNFTWRPGTVDQKNLKGTTRTLDGVIGKYGLYQQHTVELDNGILSRSGWCFIDDSERPLFDNSDWPWVEGRHTKNDQDWYLFAYGSNYKAALYDFVSISGRISLPPKFAFGAWYSRYMNYTEQQLKDIVAGYEKYDIPLDVLIIDMDWHLTPQSSPEIFNTVPRPNGWTGFTWEKKLFPDYKEFLRWTDSMHVETAMNLHPAAGVQAHEAAYVDFAKAMNFDTTGRHPIPFDITNKDFAKNYFDILLHPYERDGIDFWWLDWQQWGGTNIKGVNPTFYLNYVHFSDMQRQGKRPLIFHRYGGLGNQRYQIGFSGDVIISWRSLAYQPEFTATASNVGFGYWSHDIGGHINPLSTRLSKSPELFTRWVEWGAFSPIFRTHANKDHRLERRIWMYPQENFEAMRKAIVQRYALIPYIYTYGRFAYDSGVSLIRPMYYEYPDLDKAYTYPGQYYFGRDMIVSPIHSPMHSHKTISHTVWLPEGDWYDYRNNNLVKGGKDVVQAYGLDEVPVYVRAGSIIPTQTAKYRLTTSVMDTLILTVYPAASGSFKLYEDDGSTENYRKDICSFTDIGFTQNNGQTEFRITPDHKTFAGQPAARAYEIRLVAAANPTSVSVNGQATTNWQYDADKKVLHVFLPRAGIGESEVVAVR
jgi:alpha-glucosidase (family GH31 glycosyl hydrolase)